jgi:lipid-A-disaccharide synthase
MNPRAVLRSCSAALIKTGTSTLEAALNGIPFAMFYKTSALSYFIAKRMVRLQHISLVNILAKKSLVNEFIQHQATAAPIVEELTRLLSDAEYAQSMVQSFEELRKSLGASGASARAAESIAQSFGLNKYSGVK